MTAPLFQRIKPHTIEEIIGRDHLLTPGSPLTTIAHPTHNSPLTTAPSSLIFYGPPGTGKTTLAEAIATSSHRVFVSLNAVSATTKDIKDALHTAQTRLAYHGEETLLFIDEIYHFSKVQQDVLLPAVENHDIILIASTTDNPRLSLIPALLSRSLIITLTRFTTTDLHHIIHRALTDPHGYNNTITITSTAENDLITLTHGDARQTLILLETLTTQALAEGTEGEKPVITRDMVRVLTDQVTVEHEYSEDEFYDVVSAMIKSIRGSDPDAAIYYVARLLRLGAPPEYIARRLVISAAEDIGLANPQALPVATAAVTGVMTVGMPEAEIILAEAAIFLATSPKSRSTYEALQAAYQAMDHHPEYETAPIPSAFRNHAFDFTSTGEEQHSEYKNPHDDPRGILPQQYLPSCMGTPEYYHPATRGFEQGIHATLPALRSILHDTQ